MLRFNKLVPNSFRVVNDADVFARLPRNKGIGSVPGLTNYYHVGRTVLTSPERPSLWVEGESDGRDPLKDRSVLRVRVIEFGAVELNGRDLLRGMWALSNSPVHFVDILPVSMSSSSPLCFGPGAF